MFKRYYSHPLVIGHVAIIYTRKRDDEYRDVMMLHAIAHVRQWVTFGPFTPLVYIMTWVLLKMLYQHSSTFYSHPFEIDARRAAHQLVDVEGKIRLIRSYLQRKNKS